MPVVIENFTIEKRLGAGRLGTSFLARQQGDSGKYVVKQIFSDLAENRALVSTLSRLVDVLAARNLSGIAVYEASIYSDDEFYLVSPFVEGVTLAEVICRVEVHPLAVLYVLRSMVEALTALHRTQFSFQEGGIHGSLWPENVFLTQQGDIILKDIGTWQAPRHSLGKGSISLVDCYRYLSPGHLTGQMTCHSDIFSIGVLMYELLSSQRLFDGSGLMETVRQIEAAADRVTTGIRAIFGVVCQRCVLAGTPSGYDSMRDLGKDLKRLLPESRFAAAKAHFAELLVDINTQSERISPVVSDDQDTGQSLPRQGVDLGEDTRDTEIPRRKLEKLKTPPIRKSVVKQEDSLEKFENEISSLPSDAGSRVDSVENRPFSTDSSSSGSSIFGANIIAGSIESGASDLQQIIDQILVRPPTNSLEIDLAPLVQEEDSESEGKYMQLSSDELEVVPASEDEKKLDLLSEDTVSDEESAEPDKKGSWIKTIFRKKV